MVPPVEGRWRVFSERGPRAGIRAFGFGLNVIEVERELDFLDPAGGDAVDDSRPVLPFLQGTNSRTVKNSFGPSVYHSWILDCADSRNGKA